MRKNKAELIIIVVIILIFTSGCNTDAGVYENRTQFDTFFELLSDNGFQCIEEYDVYQEDFLAVPKRVIRINDEMLTVYEYATNQEMEDDSLTVNPDGFGFSRNGSGTQVSWITIPHWFKDGNLIILYVGTDSSLLDFLNKTFGEVFAGGYFD